MKEFTTTKTKKEVAELLEISTGTLSRWLNCRYYAEIKALGYHKNDHILTPRILNYLAQKVDLTKEK
jgi:hypothetical protein